MISCVPHRQRYGQLEPDLGYLREWESVLVEWGGLADVWLVAGK